MTLKNIGLMLSTDEKFDSTLKSDFGFRNRFVGNYLTRQLRENKIETQGFNAIMIVGCTNQPKPNYFFEKFLVVEVPFDKTKYEKLPEEKLPIFFTDMYIEGIKKAKLSHNIPYDFLMSSISDFKKNGYKNEWIFKSKNFRSIEIKAILFCKMTMDYFSLSLVLEKNGKIIFQEEAIHTKPDEIMFHHLFKDVVYEYGDIIILNRAGANIYSVQWLPPFKSNLEL